MRQIVEDKRTGGTHTKMSEEEFERFFNGCPDCGKDLKTYPIVMQGLGPRVEVPDPWPVNQWPPAPMKKHRRPVMER
jgi:hypothetical protein